MPVLIPRLVVVPGLGLDGRSWSRLRRRVPADVVLLPGMGRSAPVPPLDDLAAALRAALGAGPVVLAGHSQGCQVVAAAAGDPRVAGVVLLGPTTDPRLRSPARLARWWLRTALREPWWQLPLVLAQWLGTGPRAMRALWRVAAPDRIEDRLAAVGVPVTVVRGTRDRLCRADWARQVAAAAPRGRVVEVPGAAHMTVQTHPGEVAAVLRAALAESAGRSGRDRARGVSP
ncbi:Pimeloyl-ACP methyl ester carboxylesterase [Geodermatophilus saharensis]|uniref:Pimeloyl-ACP methyl ester carboxylesterase n=1 Tax=Geodermatophilus saharensis TaxID=1137994 RepID=A0A239EKD2_9ACTN|nr:alpha/beta fold hydrolase [Geodermatophilus saharensis]SNS45105.1 Pimeloyl-ACP methyl ester carboxylesterase [Geodermatophilus saharensis]